jgi:hypothetical protein
MAFSADAPGSGDTLYVVQGGDFAAVDTSTFDSRVIGPFKGTGSQSVGSGVVYYLSGTGAGDLFTVYTHAEWPPCALANPGNCLITTLVIGRVNKATGAVTDQWTSPVIPRESPYNLSGFAFWGGDFYFFISGVVWRFRPLDGSMAQVAQTQSKVLAAGVSTCAPLQ